MKIYDPLGETNPALFPGLNGGANHGGASFDPERGLPFVNTIFPAEARGGNEVRPPSASPASR